MAGDSRYPKAVRQLCLNCTADGPNSNDDKAHQALKRVPSIYFESFEPPLGACASGVGCSPQSKFQRHPQLNLAVGLKVATIPRAIVVRVAHPRYQTERRPAW